ENIGRAGGGLDAFRKVGNRTLQGAFDLSPEGRLWPRQYVGVLGRRRAWKRGRRDSQCGNERGATEQLAPADIDLTRGGRGPGLLARFVVAHDFLLRCRRRAGTVCLLRSDD